MENQETSTHHGAPHNLVLLLIFIVVIALLAFSINKLSHPQPAPKIPAIRTSVTVTQKNGIMTYTDRAGGFSFQYPTTITVNDDGVFKYNTLNLNYLPTTNLDRKLGNDFAPDQYAALAAAITNGTKFQPIRTAKNVSYPIRNDFQTVKIGTHYFVRDFPVTNSNCGCTEIQYVTIVGKYFVSYTMAKGISSPSDKTTPKAGATPILSSAEYRQFLVTDKESLIKREFPALEAALASLTAD